MSVIYAIGFILPAIESKGNIVRPKLRNLGKNCHPTRLLATRRGGGRRARSGDREGTARDNDGSGSGIAKFLRMPCRLEGAVPVLGQGLVTIWLDSGGRASEASTSLQSDNPWVI